jgi:hypothetical protein
MFSWAARGALSSVVSAGEGSRSRPFFRIDSTWR